MVIPRWSVTPLEEAMGVGGMTTANAMRATRPCVATMNKKYNNTLTTSAAESTMAKIQSRPTSMMLP
jgi:pyruvate/2-oxoglutarate/acetoin dehydrogenase E1 component